jgi:hypothetical protein
MREADYMEMLVHPYFVLAFNQEMILVLSLGLSVGSDTVFILGSKLSIQLGCILGS